MSSEIEKLIDLIIADGNISDKEKSVILKKAAESGIDKDEIEMILDAKMHQFKLTQTLPAKEKIGNIKKCPACGSNLKLLSSKCSACDYEYTGTLVNEYIKRFENDIKRQPEKKIEFLNALTIPNDKESIINFLNYFQGQVTTENLELYDLKYNDNLKQKSLEILMKAKVYFRDDKEFIEFLSKTEVDIDIKFKTSQYFNKVYKSKQKKYYILSPIMYVLLFVLFLIRFKLYSKFAISKTIPTEYCIIFVFLVIPFYSYYYYDYKKFKKKLPFLTEYE